MRNLIAILAGLSVVGCATAIPLSYHEHCALKGMRLAGVNSGNSYGSANSGNVRVNIDTYSENVSCVVPQTPVDKCEVSRYLKVVEPKIDYNESLGMKRNITGLGYCAGIVPGVVAKVLYDGQRSDARKASEKLEQETEGVCERAPASSSITPQ